MDFDLDRASSRKQRERSKQKQLAKLKIERKKREDEKAQAAIARLEKIQKEKRLERARIEAEREEAERLHIERTGGIQYSEILKPYPIPRAATDRLILPVSALDKCVSQDALGSHVALAFEVSLMDENGTIIATTHAGVSEFTAEEGTVGLPPKTILSLTRERGLDSLTDEITVKVEYVRLDGHPRSMVRIQPLGNGFHTKGQDVVNIDLRTVMERTLKGHMTLTKGDWVPIRHEGITYNLEVKELEPADALLLLNTDLEVDILPSEVAERELQAQEERERLQQKESALRSERAGQRSQMAQDCGARVDEFIHRLSKKNTDEVRSIGIRVRDPSGRTHTRQFPAERTTLSIVLDWIVAETPDLVPPNWNGQEYGFELVQSWPGHRAVFGVDDRSKTLLELGLRGRQESLFMHWTGVTNELQVSGEHDAAAATTQHSPATVQGSPNDDVQQQSVSGENIWKKAMDEAEAILDNDLLAEGISEAAKSDAAANEVKVEGKDLAELYHRILGSGGFEPKEAANVAQQWGSQITELEGMGFNDYVSMAELLKRYQGRLLRVVNALAEQAAAKGTVTDNSGDHLQQSINDGQQVPSVPGDVEMSSTAIEEQNFDVSQLNAEDAELFATLETEYNSDDTGGGVNNNELASAVSKYSTQFRELLGMGLLTPSSYSNMKQVIALLDKYQGRLERVVNILVES